jgi:DNA-binding transcriptional regulator YdaS (Cro superfamily)
MCHHQHGKPMITTIAKPIERAKRIAGGTTALAVKLGISKQAVSMWKKIPAERVISIEAATGISREELRPDLYPLRADR